MTSARVAVRTGAQDNAAAAKAIASSAVAKRAVNGIGEAGGARMTSEDRTEPAPEESRAFRAEPGSLYVVATPIGNLRDVTLRALDILRTVDVIRAEDTRVSATLLARYGIATRPRALHAHNEARESDAVVRDLAAGRSVALMTDAGTPAVSDPGARVVAAVVRAGHRVVPIPGASAVAAAVSTAGLEAPRFAFMGFLPPAQKARAELLALHAELPSALVLYEAPHRLGATLAELAATLDPRRTVVIARELTKTFETITRMPLADAVSWAAADANAARGEFVVIVDAPLAGGGTSGVTLDARRLLDALADELPPARAARVAAKVTQLPREVLYEMALARKR
jgi:16S rRNA (cytidine1402-2'-O)-methyltransferase